MIDTLTSVDIAEIVKCGAIFSEVFEGFFCLNLEYNLYTEFTDTFENWDLFKSQWKDLLQNLAKKIELSFYRGKCKKDINEDYKCGTETSMKENLIIRLKISFLWKTVF